MMTPNGQNRTTDTTAEGVAGEAALFVTFYADRDKGSPLFERLQYLIQKTQEEEATDGGEAPPTSILSPRVYYPPAAHYAAAITFDIDAPGNAAAGAWDTARQRLQDILNTPDLPVNWWGYTLIYQAVLNPNVSLDSVPDELLSAARRPCSSEGLEPLEQADLSGGRLWLMGIPRGDGLAAATVYVALSPSDKEKAFKQALFGLKPLMLELIAHKGYQLRREYRGALERDYEEVLGAFREGTYDLLSDLGQQIKGSSLDRVG